MHTETSTRLNLEALSLLVLGCALLCTLIVVRHIVLPQWTALAEERAINTHYTGMLSKRNDYGAMRASLEETGRKLSAKLAAMSSGMADPRDLSALLQMLITRAKRADIRFVKMEPQKETARADYVQYPVLLETKTTFHSLGRFVGSLESIPQVVRVERVAVTTGKRGAIDVKLLVVCFLQRK